MLIQKISTYNIEGLAKLFTELWTERDFEEELVYCKELLKSEKEMCLVGKDRGEYIAFIHVACRFQEVEDVSQLPVCYIKGIYVQSSFRRIGVGNHLISLAENWCKEKGCSQIAADTKTLNQQRITFYKNRGFRETIPLTILIKEL